MRFATQFIHFILQKLHYSISTMANKRKDNSDFLESIATKLQAIEDQHGEVRKLLVGISKTLEEKLTVPLSSKANSNNNSSSSFNTDYQVLPEDSKLLESNREIIQAAIKEKREYIWVQYLNKPKIVSKLKLSAKGEDEERAFWIKGRDDDDLKYLYEKVIHVATESFKAKDIPKEFLKIKETADIA